MVRQVADQIVKTGHVTRGYLGVSVQPVSKAMARAMRLPDTATTGALVAGVIPDGPAAHAGIQPGDVILAVGPTKITDPRSLAQTAAAIAPGTTTKLDVLHDGAEHMVAVDIGTQQSAEAGAQAAQHSQTGPALGLSLAPLTPDLRDQLGLGNAVKGAVIAAVRPNSPADQAGLQTGDVLLGVNGHPVASPKAAASALRDSGNADRPLALHILRDGQAAFIAIDPTQQPDNSEG
jgi:serine protease Do